MEEANNLQVQGPPPLPSTTSSDSDSQHQDEAKFGGVLDCKDTRSEDGTAQDLETTTRAVDHLKLSLHRAQVEEAQARQETELADRRLRELQRAAAAKADLQAARAEVESMEKVRAAAAAEAEAVVSRARDAAAESREARKAVEDLAAELMALKGELESSHTAHVDAEEKRLRLALAWEQDKSQWQMELEDAQQEAKRLRGELMEACDLEMKAEAASQLMATLKAETVSSQSSQAMLRKELEDVKGSLDRARDEARCLRVAAASMRDDLDKEKAELAALRRREASIPPLQEELSRLTSDSRMMGAARREAEEAKAKLRSAHEDVARAREEAGVAKAAVATMEARLEAVTREALAATASEEIATASAAALQQSKGGVAVALTEEEYEELSRRARETEETAGKRVTEAVKLIKEAKDAEVRILEKLARQGRRTEQRRQALEAATLEAEEAEFAKLSAERELRQWRAEHESPRTGLAQISVLHHQGAADGRGNPHILSPRGGYYMPRTDFMAMGSTTADADAEAEARQRKTTFFPRMIMFLARRRAQASWRL